MPLLAVRGNGPALAYGFGALSGKADAMTAIASQTISVNTNPVNFNSIPGTYDDLFLAVYARNTTDGQNNYVRFNSNTNTDYSSTVLAGDGDNSQTSRLSSRTLINLNYFNAILAEASKFSAFNIHILNYANTTSYKTVLCRHAGDNNLSDITYGTELAVGLWRSTSAITSITFLPSAGSYAPGSVFALYGIKRAA
jgi:hypothetical protein